MHAELVTPASSRWAEVLSAVRHDFYHLPAYVLFAARWQETGEPLAFIAEDDVHRFIIPLIVRPIPRGVAGDGPPVFDATGPRGYPGPLLGPGHDGEGDGFIDGAIDALADVLRERRIVAAFIRMHPLLSPPVGPFARTGELVSHGDSTSIDLTLSHEELWRQTAHGHRQRISKATRLGYAARMDEDWERFDDFVAVYQESMRRLGASPFWHFSREYFSDLRETLGERLHLCVVEIDGEVASAGLLTELDGIVEFHLSGTANAYLAASPSKILIDHARWWAKARKNAVLHLTGSLRQGDSLSEFKAGFSPLRHPVLTWRFISDRTAYDGLVARSSPTHDGAGSADGYFPAYRGPGRGAS